MTRQGRILWGLAALLSLWDGELQATHAPHPPTDHSTSCQTLAHFSPHGSVADAIVGSLRDARQRVRVALYGLTAPPLVEALIKAHRRGVDVQVKLDRMQSQGKSQAEAVRALRAAGLSVQVSEFTRLLHDKFAVVDGRLILTGSYNWTGGAETSHRENLLILDCSDLARTFEAEWELIEIAR